MEQSTHLDSAKPFLLRRENRYLWYILVFPLFFACFFWLNNSEFHAVWTTDLPIDRQIPYCRYFALLYVLWYALLAGTGIFLLLKDHEGFKCYATLFGLGCSTALLVYILIPNQQTLRDMCDFTENDLCNRIIQGIQSVDVNRNVCPSLHVVGTLACLFPLLYSPAIRSKWLKAALIPVTVLVCASTVFVKQHGIIDIIIALPFSAVFYFVTYYGVFPHARKPAGKVSQITGNNVFL